MARNKRLHVELCLIKLNFLQQALELTVENGAVVKKKRVDGPLALKMRPIPALQQKASPAAGPAAGPKLYIQPEAAQIEGKGQTIEGRGQVTDDRRTGASGGQAQVMDTATATQMVAQTPTAYQVPKTKRSLLEALRDKYGEQYQVEEVQEAEPLNMEKLREIWNAYGQKLEKAQKHSAANTFRLCKMELESESHFVVTVKALIQQNFIEQEKMMVTDALQQAFFNRSIGFHVEVDQSEMEEEPANMSLNSRQRYEKITSQYPWVKELKDRLRLDLDNF
jgi:DNA polymerase-3 subunit gamma/tau